MAPSITVAAIRRASRAAADSGLKAAGFRRQGNHLHRQHGDTVHAVHFQGSRWASRTAGAFTVNLVVTSDFVYSTWMGEPLPSNPATALFPVQERIGSLMPGGRDHWWEVDDQTDLVALSRDVAAAVLRYGLPFFDDFESAESMLLRLRSGRVLPGLSSAQAPLVQAVLAVQVGAREEAQQLLAKTLIDAGSTSFGGTVRRVAERLGVALP